MILLVLAGIWAAVLIPPIVRARSIGRPNGTVGDFRRQLQTLARTTPSGRYGGSSPSPYLADSPGPLYRIGPSLTPRERTLKRRRDVFVGLVVAAVGSLILGFLPQLRVLWMVHIGIDVLLGVYVAALISIRNTAAERETKVRLLPSHQQAPEPAYLLRRSAN